MTQIDVLAILGRGVERVCSGVWRPTSLIEQCDQSTREHLGIRTPHPDHSNSGCIVGGGNANVIAGLQLYGESGAKTVCFAYGDTSKYLRRIDGPSEGEVMMESFERRLSRVTEIYALANDVAHQEARDNSESYLAKPFRGKTIRVSWGDGKWKDVELRAGLQLVPGIPSNTLREIQNVFDLALQWSLRDVTVLTVSVHLPRTIMFGGFLVKGHDAYRKLRVSYVATEDVLLRRSARYRAHIDALRTSVPFWRNFELERRGMQAFSEGNYASPQGTSSVK